MNSVLIYVRSERSEPIANQTTQLLSEQFQQIGLNVEVTGYLNLPRLILNSYQTIHLIIENLPLTLNETLHLALCKTLGKSTVLSVLNSESKPAKNFLDFIKPDAFSVSQTNHLKNFRSISSNKFILSGFPKNSVTVKKLDFAAHAFLVPLQNKFEEIFNYKINHCVYFDGRKLLKKMGSAQLRKKWAELVNQKKINSNYHLVLSDAKINELLTDELLYVVLADTQIKHTEFICWLNISTNNNNVLLINEFQATGFSTYWTSGRNCHVLSATNWLQDLNEFTTPINLVPTHFKISELLEASTNELSRLYSKLWHQKTSLLTSRSVKL